MREFDVLIIGGGVAGMSAAIYAKRAGKNVAIVERLALGGQVLQLQEIENFPSQQNVDGITLAQMFKKQIKALSIDVIFDEILSASLLVKPFELKGKNDVYLAKKVVFATGISYKALQIGEDDFLGCGASFCAVCDGNFYKDKVVAVASRKGSGVKDALYLCNIAKEVLLLDEEDMSIYVSANKVQNLKVVSNCKIEKLVGVEKFGQKSLSSVETKIDGKEMNFDVSALFISLGRVVDSQVFGGQLEVDAKGYVLTNERMRTSVEGVYAVGDVRNGVMKQIVTACSDGAIAGNDC